jgi:hypothetical protein
VFHEFSIRKSRIKIEGREKKNLTSPSLTKEKEVP